MSKPMTASGIERLMKQHQALTEYSKAAWEIANEYGDSMDFEDRRLLAESIDRAIENAIEKHMDEWHADLNDWDMTP